MRYKKIVYIEIDKLKEYENNPRRNDNAVSAVAESIKKFNFQVPVVVDSDNVIMCGHTRVKAAKKLGMETVPCIIANDLTPEQIKAFRLADNKTGELAGWDFTKLEEELAALDGFDMSAFGFVQNEDADIDSFFEDAEEKKEKEPKRIQCPHCGEWFEA